MEYFVKKVVKAKTFQEALANESKGEILHIWTEDETKKEQTPAIGFEVDEEEITDVVC